MIIIINIYDYRDNLSVEFIIFSMGSENSKFLSDQ